jgi:hypothetical protein
MRDKMIMWLIGCSMVISVGVIMFFSISYINYLDMKEIINEQKIKSLKDSLERDCNQKLMESYPYDHSEIKDTTVKSK